MPETILVTGGAGFIGGCFIRMFAKPGIYRVVNLDRLTYAGNLDSLSDVSIDCHNFVQGDIGDRPLVDDLLARFRPSRVVHFAAETHVDRSIDGPMSFVTTNVLGTANLLEACRQYWTTLPAPEVQRFRFLHVSTDEVFGSLGPEGYFTEQTPYAPRSPYSASKAGSDHLVRAYFATYGFPVLVTNCSNNYGPYQFPEKLIPLMTLNAIEGKPLPVYGDGSNVRDWLYVEDHCLAVRRVLEAGQVGQTYNIGGRCEKTNLEIVRLLCRTVQEHVPGIEHRCQDLVTFVPDRPGHDHRYAIDSSKIEKELGWRPQVSFEQGLLRTVQWYIQNREWIERVQSGRYRRERLGLGEHR